MRPALASVLLLLALLPARAHAQGDAPELPPAVADAVARSADALPGSGLDAAAVERVQALLDRARQDGEAADAARADADALREEADRAEREVATLEGQLRTDPEAEFAAWRRRQPATDAVAPLERRRAQVQAEYDTARAALAQTGAALGEVLASRSSVDPALADAEARQRDAAAAAQAAYERDGGAEREAAALAAAAAWRRAAAERLRAEAEIATLPVRQRLYEARQHAQERAVAVAQRKLEFLLDQLAVRREAAVVALHARVVEAATPLIRQQDESGAVQAQARAMLDYADRLLERDRELAAARAAVIAAASDAERAAEVLHATEARLLLGEAGDALALTLLRQRARLESATATAVRLAEVRRRMSSARLTLIDLREARDASNRPRDDAADVDALAPLVALRPGLLDELAQANRELVAALASQEAALQSQLASLNRLDALLDRRLLWTPSHPPVDAGWLRRHPEGWRAALDPAPVARALQRLRDALPTQWPLLAGGLALAAAALAMRLRLPRRLRAFAAPLRQVRSDRFDATVAALLLTLIAALPGPLVLATLGAALEQVSADSRAGMALAQALLATAPALYAIVLLRLLVREDGLAQAHLRWTPQRCAALRDLARWLVVLLPVQFVLIHVFVRQHEVALDVVGRDLLLVWCAVAAWAVWRLLAPDGVWHARRRRAEPSRARRALRVTLMVGAALLAAQVLLGYTVTVGTMVHAFWTSCLAALAVGLVRGLAERWFLLGERRLALFRYRRRRDAARTAAHGTEENVEPDPDSLPLDRVSAQRRRLLRALTVLLAAIALLWIWGPLLPALDRLDEMRPWDSETSLRAILYGLGILAATAVAARNLPGFLEVALSARTRLDASTRYAVTSIARYVIVIGGVTIGLGLLGMRWNNLQWMAAALTVGLGFGLQEIFANFVSGLILLVERPFRIGDQITIGEFTGTVTRIRTRATTLVDFDNREVVVPNKAFITDRLINWTLSDTRTRVVVRATVARDADPDAVHGVLLAAARAHPLVLAEPAPWSSFAGIGPNGLDFELFVHVRALADRGEVVNALNSRIVRDLEAAGIGLAFAQMDLRVREERPGSAAAPPPPPAPGPAAG